MRPFSEVAIKEHAFEKKMESAPQRSKGAMHWFRRRYESLEQSSWCYSGVESYQPFGGGESSCGRLKHHWVQGLRRTVPDFHPSKERRLKMQLSEDQANPSTYNTTFLLITYV